MGIRITGLDGIKRNLENLARRAHQLDGSNKVALADLFTTDFIRRFTDFLTLEEMFAASGFRVGAVDDLEAIPSDEWDAFIRDTTLFFDWQDMREKAVAEWTSRRLGLSE